MATDIPRIEVPAGAFTPARFGLFSVAAIRPMPESQGVSARGTGVQLYPTPCGPASLTIDGCFDGADLNPASKTFRRDGWIGTRPFTVYAGVACPPVGQSWDEARQRAQQALLNGEQWTAERAYGSGQSGTVRPSLAASTAEIIAGGVVVQPDAVVVTGGSGIVSTLAELEQALGDCYAGEGVIHVQRRVVPYLSARGLVRVDGDRLRTYNGNPVLVGSGLPGTGPAGQAASASSSWIYATGAVQVWRSEVWFAGGDEEGASIDRGVNDRKILAERTYNVAYECCLLAASLTLTETT